VLIHLEPFEEQEQRSPVHFQKEQVIFILALQTVPDVSTHKTQPNNPQKRRFPKYESGIIVYNKCSELILIFLLIGQ